MIFIQRGAIKVGCHKLYQHRHEVTVTADSGIVNLLLISIVANGSESETTILLADKCPISIGHLIHIRYCPKCHISPVSLIDMLHIDVGREAVNVLSIITLETEHAIHY